MEKLSVVIITFNEERNIGKCIDSVAGIADDIVILDSFSTDRTEAIAKEKGVRFVQHKFDGHIQQKNRAITHALYPFVLSLDADEVPDETLKANILRAKQDKKFDGYTMNRLNFYCGHPVKTCGWYPDRKLRLWDSGKGAWTGQNPHDRYELKEGSSISHLEGNILHDTYPRHEDMLRQVKKFAEIAAHQLKKKNVLYLFFKLLTSPVFKFIRNYIIKLGFTEGARGFSICYHQMREVFIKYFKAIKYKYSS